MASHPDLKSGFRLPTLGHLLKNFIEQEHVDQALASGDPSTVEATMRRPGMDRLLLDRTRWEGLFQLSSESALAELLARRESLMDHELLDALLQPTPQAQARMRLWCDAVNHRLVDAVERANTWGEAARQAVDRQAWAQAVAILSHLRLNRDSLVSLVTRAAERDAPPEVFDAILARSETGQPIHFGGTVDVLVARQDWARLRPLVRHCSAEQSLLSLQRLLSAGQHDLAQRWLAQLLPDERQNVFERLRTQAEACVHPASKPSEDDWRVLDGVGLLMSEAERESWAAPWGGQLPLTEQRILAGRRDTQARAAMIHSHRTRLRS